MEQANMAEMNGKLADFRELTLEEMQDCLVQMGEKPFRAKQIFAWVYRGARSFDEMTDISKSLREKH